MASLSGPNPLSAGAFQQDAGASGVPAALGGVSALGSAIANGRMQQAQAGYMGTEAGRTVAQTRQINKAVSDGQLATSYLQSWAKTHDPADIQNALAVAAGNVDVAAHAPALIAAMYQAAANGGQGVPGAPSQTLADTISAGTGTQTAGNTITGQGRQLANDRATTGITAGATRYTADAAAGASMTNERVRQAGENARGLTTVLINGVPTVVTNVDAGRLRPQAYDSAVARENVTQGGQSARDLTTVLGGPDGKTPIQVTTTEAGQKHLQHYDAPKAAVVAGNDSKYAKVAGPGNTTNLMPQEEAARTGANVRPDNTGEVSAAAGQDAMAAGPLTPEDTANLRFQIAGGGGAFGVKPDAISPKDMADMDKQISARIAANNPGIMNATPDASLMDPIRQQAAWLYQNDPHTRNNMQAAVTQAIQNVAGPKGENTKWDDHVSSYIPGSGRKAHMVLVDPAKINWPPGQGSPLARGIRGPATPAPAAAPAQTEPASPVAGAIAPPASASAPAPAPAPAPQPAAAPAPQQQAQAAPPQPAAAPSGLREGQTATGPKGEKWVFRNGKWAPL